MSTIEDRITQLEIRHTYSDEMLETLSQLIREQQIHIDDLKKEIKRLSAMQEADNEDAPPPHY